MKHVAPAALAASTALVTPRSLAGRLRADASDPKQILAQLAKDFADFKTENDERLRGKADVLVDEKVDRINASVSTLQTAIDDLNVKLAAAQMGAGGGRIIKPEDAEYARDFQAHVRRGQVTAAMSRGSDPDGGYTAPIEWDRTVGEKLKLISPIRQNATVQPISTAGFKKLFTDRAVGSGWVGETAARPSTSTPQFGSMTFTPGEIYANAPATQQLLDDSQIDIETWLQGEIETEFARQEGIAFISGDGTNKPYGLLTFVTGAANAALHPWGAITANNSGAAAALTSDGMINIIYAQPAMWSPNAKFYMNRQTAAAMRKLKDGQGNYLWQPSYQQGQPATLAGEPIVDTPDMPNVAAGNVAALYGDMAETYLIVDRIGIRVLRDPYTNKPYIQFYVTKRVGGGVKNPQAMQALVISA